MKTKSVRSNKPFSLFTRLYGAAPSSFLASESTFTILGPKNPICNHIEAEPGPPLKTKVTGRLVTSPIDVLVYATDQKEAIESPSLFVRKVSLAVVV